MDIQYFNTGYFLYLTFAVVFVSASYLLLRNKSKMFKTIFVSTVLFVILILHFSKLMFPPYVNHPYALKKISAENICAVSVMLFPFVFLSKNKYLKDYMFYIGTVSGLGAVLLPAEAIGKSAFCYDTIRFYFAHIGLAAAPFLMVVFGLHKIDYRRNWAVPLVFIGVLGIVLINEVILFEVGLLENAPGFENSVNPYNAYNPLDPYNPQGFRWRNFSMIFGPAISEEFAQTQSYRALHDVMLFFTPKIFKTMPAGVHAGAEKPWPLLWIVVPAYIFISLWCFLLCLIWDRGTMKAELVAFKAYLRRMFVPTRIKREKDKACENEENTV